MPFVSHLTLAQTVAINVDFALQRIAREIPETPDFEKEGVWGRRSGIPESSGNRPVRMVKEQQAEHGSQWARYPVEQAYHRSNEPHANG